MILTDLGDTYLKGHFIELGVPYRLLVATTLLMSGWGWVSTKPKHHRIIAVLVLASLVAHAGYQLIDLDWARTR